MKTALIISGQARFLDVAYPFLKKNFLDLNDVDIFIHTWNYSNLKPGDPFPGASWNIGKSDVYLGEETQREKILELYKPKSLLVDDQSHFLEGVDFSKHPLTNGENLGFITRCMFYSIKKSFDALEEYASNNGIKYDAVVRTRFDAAPLSPIVMNSDENGLNMCFYYADVCRNKSVMSDWFFYSSFENMKEMCSVYNDIERFVFKEGVLCCGEEIIMHKLREMLAQRRPVFRSPVRHSLFLVRDNEFKNKDFGIMF